MCVARVTTNNFLTPLIPAAMAEPPTSAFEFNTLHRNPMHESLNPQHLVDHVATWLEGHPCKSEDYEESNADLAWPPIKKRTRDTKSQDAQEPQRKARCLAQISGNSMRRRSPRKTPTNEQAQPILQDQSPLRNKAIDLVQGKACSSRSKLVQY